MSPTKHGTVRQASRSLAVKVRSDAVLWSAWRHIRSNGLRSLRDENVELVKKFDRTAAQSIKRISRLLREQRFKFEGQDGIAQERPGKRPRPIVVAPIPNRIVQRALLEVLQRQDAVRSVLACRTSFGGIERRSRSHAIALAHRAIRDGHVWYIRSDIANFFGSIRRAEALELLGRLCPNEPELLDLLRAATTTELRNLELLGEHAALFPVGADGVAQGCCLSTLLGNVLLANFDAQMNDRGIVCIRYIDDFLLLGRSKSGVRTAFRSALATLTRLGLSAYDPADGSGKAAHGHASDGIEFLGCDVFPSHVQPSQRARSAFVAMVDEAFTRGLASMARMARGKSRRGDGYAQVLVRVDRLIKGWGHAYSFCNAPHVMRQLDEEVRSRRIDFQHRVRRLVAEADAVNQSRLVGIHLLQDTPRVALDTLEMDLDALVAS